MFSWLKKKSKRPDAASVMKRIVVLRHLFVKALAFPNAEQFASISSGWTQPERDTFQQECLTRISEHKAKLSGPGLWAEMEPAERGFIEAMPNEISIQAQIDASWFPESVVCLRWALNELDLWPPYDQQSSEDVMKGRPDESVRDLLRAASLRPSREIDSRRDMAELWHWRCRTRQLIEQGKVPSEMQGRMDIDQIIGLAATKAAEAGEFVPIGGDFPAFGKPFREASQEEFQILQSIAQERHKALNWLCGYAPNNRWSETPTNT